MSHYPASSANKQRGFTIIMAIFIVVVLGLLGAYMLRLTGVQYATATYALQNARAYQAARSGLSWASASINYQAINGNGCTAVNLITATNPLSLPAMPGFTITLTCKAVPVTTPYKLYQENQGKYYIYILTAHSEFGAYNSADYVSKQIEKSVMTVSIP